jgi:hypothetical protein
LFAFTTRLPACCLADHQMYDHQLVDGFDIYSHGRAYITTLLAACNMSLLGEQPSWVGADQFNIWLAHTPGGA